MYIKRGTRARFNMTDGSALEGVVQFSWSLTSWKITKVHVHTPHGMTEAGGDHMIVPKRHVTMVQVGV